MSETKHTPGPWEVSPNWPFPTDLSGRTFDAVAKKFGDTTSLICSFQHSVMRDSQNANARLIAAAPELLVICEAISRAWKHTGNEPKRHPELEKELQRVIAKATEGSE